MYVGWMIVYIVLIDRLPFANFCKRKKIIFGQIQDVMDEETKNFMKNGEWMGETAKDIWSSIKQGNYAP